MAYEIVKTKSIKATASFASKQFTFVTIDSNGQISTPTLGAHAWGVVQDKPAAADPGAVCFPGDITKVLCGDTFAAGDLVATDASGRAIPAVSGYFVLGIALSAGAVSKIATIIYQPRASKL